MRKFCVLVHSSDRTRDVFEAVFKNAEEMWRDCKWPRFAGFTTPPWWLTLYGFTSVSAKGPSSWRGELADHLDALPPEIEYVLRLDDDAFASRPIEGIKLEMVARLIDKGGLAYVKLLPVARNVFGRIIEYFRRKGSLRPIAFTEPYYCSLVPAIWKRSYLREILREPRSVWDFELTVTKERHYAVWEPVLDLDHIVTNGKWAQRARRMDNGRGVQSLKSWLRQKREDLSFALFGFLGFRIRRYFGRLPRMPKDLQLDHYNLAVAERIAAAGGVDVDYIRTLLSHPRTESSIRRALRVRLPALLKRPNLTEEHEGVKRALSFQAFVEYAGPLVGKSEREWFSL